MGLDRRGFIKFILGGAAGSMLTPIPWKLTDDAAIWTQNWPWIPKNLSGPSEYVPTVSKLCSSGCGLLVRTVGGNPVRTVGNPDHPLSGGKLTALAAAEVQLLYSPARLKRPLIKKADGSHVAITWEEAAELLKEKLGSTRKVACLSGDETGSINEVLSAFLKKLGSDKFFVMPGDFQASTAALSAMGASGQVGYDIESADYVLAIGADILESSGTVVRNRRVFAESRPHGEEASVTFAYAGPVQNNTAVGADTWLPIKPGTEAALAYCLANLIDGSAPAYTTAKVAALTGASEDAIKALAKDIQAAGKAVAIVGTPAGQGGGAATAAAGIALNMALGSLTILPDPEKALADAMTRTEMMQGDFVSYIGKQTPDVLVVYEANPVYALPGGKALAEKLKGSFTVSFTSFLDETAEASDLVLPVPLGLERYDDSCTPYGCAETVYSLAQPIIEPLVDAKNGGDFIIELAAAMGKDLGVGSFKDVLKQKAQALGADFRSLEGGEAYTAPAMAEAAVAPRPAALPKASEGLALAPISKLNVGSRYVATPPFNLKTIRDSELLGNESFVELNAKTAEAAGLSEGSKVKVTSEAGEITARVHIAEGVMDGVVAGLLGLGHTAYDQYTKGKGSNLAELFVVKAEAGSRMSVWADTTVSVAKI